jgi:hypothetical protein
MVQENPIMLRYKEKTEVRKGYNDKGYRDRDKDGPT